jgi:protoporphyrinogen oxidase
VAHDGTTPAARARAAAEAVVEGRCVIIGAGPAGLTAGYQLLKCGVPAVIFESEDIVGGIARTDTHEGYRFDIGGHRFFTKIPLVAAIWEEILGKDLLTRPRTSRIYYNDRFYSYPIEIWNALSGLGSIEALRIVLSFAKARLFPKHNEISFEEWVTNRFGKRLFKIFFETYTEKVWGMRCSEIGAEWAAQRIKNLDLIQALRNAIFGARRRNVVTSLIEEFSYPRLGPGMLWERCERLLADGGVHTVTGARVVGVAHANGRIESVTIRDKAGDEKVEPGALFITSMPLRDLILCLDPLPPPEVVAAAKALRYRDFLTVVLIIERPEVFPDQWIYIHTPSVAVGRIQNFKNWSPDMVPNARCTALGLEYFLWSEHDALWGASDEELIALAKRELAQLALAKAEEVVGGCVVRMPKAYPVYDRDYRNALAVIRRYLARFRNLESIGRNGQHRYNNQDHSMLTAIYAVRKLLGEDIDCWDVNVEGDYHEEISRSTASGGDRMVPMPLPRPVGHAGTPAHALGAEPMTRRATVAKRQPSAVLGSRGERSDRGAGGSL